VYLPLYAAGIVGPATGAVVVAAGGLAAPFVTGAIVFLVGAVVLWFGSPLRAGAVGRPDRH
jgi:hypothetical protein